jgi:hypothetical protein
LELEFALNCREREIGRSTKKACGCSGDALAYVLLRFFSGGTVALATVAVTVTKNRVNFVGKRVLSGVRDHRVITTIDERPSCELSLLQTEKTPNDGTINRYQGSDGVTYFEFIHRDAVLWTKETVLKA